jgi:hypothetical protein
MIKEYLRDLTLIDSVEAIAIYAIDKSILDNWSRPNFQNNILKEISLHYLQMFYLLETDVNNFREIIISHDRGYIYARALPDLMLIIISRIPVDISLLRLIINVKIPDLLNSRAFQKKIKKVVSNNSNFLDKKFLDDSEKEYLKKLGL